MNQTDLQSLWNESSRRLDASLTEARATRERLLLRTRARLGGLSVGTLVSTLIAGLLFYLTCDFLLGHLEHVGLVASAAAVLLHLGYVIWAGAWEIIDLNRLDYGQPVPALQAEILRLRMRKFRAEKRQFLLAMFTWLPAALILLAAVGIDLLAKAPAAWIVGNLGFGALVAILGQWMARRWVEIDAPGPLGQRVLDTITGRRLRTVLASLAEWERIESEGGGEQERFLR